MGLFQRLVAGYRRISWADRLLWIQAYVWLGIMRFAINWVQFSTVARLFGTHQAETPLQVSTEHRPVLRRVKWAIVSASRFTPWESNCFPQATAAQFLLRQRGINSTLYLGAKLDDSKPNQQRELKAHAWLRVGPYIVTGQLGYKQFGVVATFASQT